MSKSLLSLAITAAVLSGCSLIPDYQQPQAPVAAQYPQGPAYSPAEAANQAKSDFLAVVSHEIQYLSDQKYRALSERQGPVPWQVLDRRVGRESCRRPATPAWPATPP